MRTQMLRRGVTVAGAVLLALTMSAHAASAQVSFPSVTRTKNFNASLIRAMDECTAPTLTVLDAGMPAAACPQTNIVTDDTLLMEKAKVRVTKKGVIRVNASGLTDGDLVRVRLTLRVTRQGVTTNMGTGSVTFSDVTVDCPAAPDAIAAKSNGSISARTELGACLAPTSGLATGNIEILEARLINVVNDRVVAAPGVMVQP